MYQKDMAYKCNENFKNLVIWVEWKLVYVGF